MVNLIKLLSPRLDYRLRSGHWCDHQTYRYHSWVDEVDVASGAVCYDAHEMESRGWGDWIMIQYGMDKIRFCHRCGHAETLSGPVHRIILRDIGYWWSQRSDDFHTGTLAFGSVGFGAAFMAMVLFAPAGLDYGVAGALTVILAPVLRRVWRERG